MPLKIEDLPEGTLIADGWDEALLGYGWRVGTPIAVYDRDKIQSIMTDRDGLSYEEAEEHISYNIEGAYVGEGTPLLVRMNGEE